ncbi:Phosphatidylinositol 4-kinase type 2-beta [Trapelia coarctata]|nr:Phosphatidylinositol 4-kinase type 2-beta [Trapelia coarctata]
MHKATMHIILLLCAATAVLGACNHDNCYRALAGHSASASAFCATYTTAVQTATTAFPIYATPCSSTPARISSACSCVFPSTTTTTAPGFTPTPIINATYRNGDFNEVPYGPSHVNTDESPWFTVTSTNATIEYVDHGGIGYATFLMLGQTYNQGNTFARINNPITVYQQTYYTMSFIALQSNPQKQNCVIEIGWNDSNYGIVFPNQFNNESTIYTFTFQSTYLGPTPANPDGTFNTYLSLLASCYGIKGQPATDVSVQLTGLVIDPA